ncbi:biotin-dependent carboxyltransferase family protein [Altibacter sp.]|uniref:5-oxoprolinase subunit C family protein n=1 Tax=Altibacter sp. TaxID=2024823 RepID=UPI000C993EF7|nr:biotin-dependent carboxyltransferase family protein [Altibacter sp.]MAP54932.1 allophanate hydrolase [Altibacter sp.]
MVEVLSGGMHTTIQDMGRFGYRAQGVPVSGVMDRFSARLSNKLLGNAEGAAVMEITHIGPVLRFTQPTLIAITGAGFSPTCNDVEIPLNTRVLVAADAVLKFGLPNYGLRAYMAVLGGFQTEYIMGSYSFYEGVTQKTSLTSGDVLPILAIPLAKEKTTASVKIDRTVFENRYLEVLKGAEFDQLSKSFQEKLVRTSAVVSSKSNRMAYLLEGFQGIKASEIITAPVQPGTVQLMPSGHCAVLMRDAQTTGGYARILQLTEGAINILAQKRAGDQVEFYLKE